MNLFLVPDNYTSAELSDPTATLNLFGIKNFNVEYWNGSAWVIVPNGNVTNNNKVIVKLKFAALTTSKIRVVVNGAHDAYSRIVELEAWGQQ